MQLLYRRCGYVGMRVGEASNPGPAGSRRTQRKRQADPDVLHQILQLLLTLLLQLGGKHGNALAPVLGQLTSLLGKPSGVNGPSGVSGDKPSKKRPAPKSGKPASSGLQPKTGDGKPATSKQRTAGEAGKPADAGQLPNRSDGNVALAAKKARSDKKAQPGQTATPPAVVGGGAPTAQLSPSDWHGQVLSYAGFASALTGLQAGPLVVSTSGAEQADAGHQLLQLSNTQHSALFVWRDEKGPQTLPFRNGTRLCMERVSTRTFERPGVALPSLKMAAKAPATAPTRDTTCVLRFIAPKDLVDPKQWQAALTTPRAFLREWVKASVDVTLQDAVKDAWGFSTEKRGGGQSVVGLLRVKAVQVTKFLGCSGEGGCFLETVGQHASFPQWSTEWTTPPAGSTPAALLNSLLKKRADYGLALGDRQIGLRNKTDGATMRQRTWHLGATPLHWTDDYVQQLVSAQTSLQAVSVLRRQVRRKACHWWVRGTAPRDADLFQLQITTEENAVRDYWLTPALGRSHHRPQQPIPEHRPFIFGKEPHFETTAVVQTEVTGEDGKAVSAPKRIAAGKRLRKLPDGVHRRSVPADGNCFFHCVSEAWSFFTGKPQPSPMQARAEIIAHMRRHRQEYEPFWDGFDSGSEASRKRLATFDDYLAHMGTNATWAGGLEILAAARHYAVSLVVLPEDASHKPCVVHPRPKQARIALWYTGTHYDWLEPAGGKDSPYPASLQEIDAKAGTADLPRGGGSEAATSFTSKGTGAGTVFTRCTRKTTWTGPSPSALPPGTERTIGAVAASSGTEAQLTDFDDLPDPASHAPVPKKRPRPKRERWACPKCNFTTAARLWPQRKRAHILAWHPDDLEELNLHRRPDPFRQLGPEEGALWRCPLCPLGLPVDCQLNSDQRLLARHRHHEQAHPEAAWELFTHVRSPLRLSNVRKATQAVRSAGVASRLLRAKHEAPQHDLVFVTLPTTGRAKTAWGQKRKSDTRVICRKCTRTSARICDLGRRPCTQPALRGRHATLRQSMQKRLQQALHELPADSPLRAGALTVLEILQCPALSAEAQREGEGKGP